MLKLNGQQISATCFEGTADSAVTRYTEVALAHGMTLPISQ